MSEQDYYWTPKWQADEQESLAELAAGHGLRFDSAQAAIDWLLSDEDATAPGQADGGAEDE